MPTLRIKRKSDSFVIDHDKAIKKLATEKRLAAEKKLSNEKKLASERKKANETKKNASVPLSSQLKSLQEAFNALAVENDENKKLVEILKEKVSELQKSHSINKESKESQTEMNISSIEHFKCQKCEFQGSSSHIMEMHLKTEHRIQDNEIIQYSCHECCKHCESYGELMKHMKDEHLSLTRVCSFFLEGKCIYDKGVCWFKHEQLETTQNSTIQHKLKEYICGFCGKLFESKNECMIHRKKEHVKSVSECFENENGKCRFGDEKCWFRHERKILNNKSEKSVSENSGIETTDMIKRLFDIMEAFGERMCIVENQI